MEVPVRYFQSVIAIELAVAGALLWQVRFFESSATAREQEQLPDPRLRLALALVLGATVFGSLWGMANEGETFAAIGVTGGLAVSVLRSLLRVLSPLVRDALEARRVPSLHPPPEDCGDGCPEGRDRREPGPTDRNLSHVFVL